jgi:Zn-dependent M28 family amino/carboxypeptidase
MRISILFLTATSLILAQKFDVSGERIRQHVRFLSLDLLEGRGVGSRGGDLATEYIATQFALAGVKPAGDNGTYFQRVPLAGVTTEPEITMGAEKDRQTVSLRWLDDYVGVTDQQQPQVKIDGEAIFMGHGIDAPEFNWDDYKDVDVKGKVVFLFTNEPPSDDPKFFGGKALTYYGRWTYKYEEATRRGAQAVFIIHTTPTAGYGYDVVRSSWGKENPQVRLAEGEHALAFAAWITADAANRLLALSGHNVDELLKAANTRGFHPMPLGFRVTGNVPTKIRMIESRNVVGRVEGSDPTLKRQAVVFSAHWDHLGIGTPVNGDAIYNGAVDNGTGCGILIELARAWAEQPAKPKRSALFVAVTAEEAGLLGSEYFAGHPVIPDKDIALDLNYDALMPLGRTRDISVSGAERTTVWPIVETDVRAMGLSIKPDAHPEQGAYYRSDHFSFARAGVPAFSIDLGQEFVGKPADFGEKAFQDYNANHYHQPSDEYHADWNFAGLEEATRLGLKIGYDVANDPKVPTWHARDEFLAAREKSGVKEAAGRYLQ